MKGVALLLALLVVAAASAAHASGRHLHLTALNGGSASTLSLKAHHEQAPTHTHPEADTFAQWIVQLRGPIKMADRRAVEELMSAGEPHEYQLGAYVPHNSYVLVAPRHVADKAAASEHVLWVGRWEREYRLVEGSTKAYEKAAKHEPLALTVLLAADLPEATRSIAARWATGLADAFGGGSAEVSFAVELPGEHDADNLLVVRRVSNEAADAGVAKHETRAIVEWLAAQPETHFVEPLSGQSMHFYAQVANALVQSGNTGADTTPYWTEGLNGTATTIGIVDSGVDFQHCFFENAAGGPQPPVTLDGTLRKITSYYSTINGRSVGDSGDATGHGSIVAGVAAGLPLNEADGSFTERGVAFGAKLVVLDILVGAGVAGAPLAPPSDYRGTLRAMQRSSVDVVINAFGVNGTGTGYSSLDAGLDAILSSDNNLLVVVAAGNDVAGSRELTSPGRAKNALTVGVSLNAAIAFQDAYIAGDYAPSTQQTDNRNDANLYGSNIVDGDSPRGTTFDGRVKPDLVAPGRPVRTAEANSGVDACTTTVAHGSSVSAGIVAGLAGLLRSFAATGQLIATRFNPSGPLLKALLINSGQAMLHAGLQSNGGGDLAQAGSLPNSVAGWGIPNLQSLGLLNDTFARSHFALDRVPDDFSGLNTGEVARFCLNVNATAAEEALNTLRVTLTWYDTAGVVGTGIALVNNLDLVVMRPDGSLVYANGLNTYDGVNNVEQISLGAGQFTNGNYRIYVIGTNVPQPPKKSDDTTAGQFFALVATGESFDTPSDADGACISTICPNSCGGTTRGTCDTTTGACTCATGFFGIDCSLTACSPACSVSQRCDYNTLTCITTDTTQIVVDKKTKRTGITAGILAGSLVGVCVICCILCCLVGFCLAVGAMEARRYQYKRRILKKRQAQMGSE